MSNNCYVCGNKNSSFKPPKNLTSTFGGTPIDASCVFYTGHDLACISVSPNMSLEDALININSLICSSEGINWANFDYHCLDDNESIYSASQFVSAITEQFCNLKNDFNTFVGTTYTSAINLLTTQINAIYNPGLNLSCISVSPSDTYTSIIFKINSTICSIKDNIDVSKANWNQCMSVLPIPTTVLQAFNVIIGQICELRSTSGNVVLPTFNNQNTCLPPPLGTNDSLVVTINKIKTRLCQTGVYNIDSTPWGCVPNPAPGTGTNLQAAINAIVSNVNTLNELKTSYDPDYFVVTSDDCDGRFVTLTTPIAPSDRFVASDSSDSLPGTLVDKLEGGTGIVIDNIANPGKIVISSNITSTDQLVKATASDPSAGFLNTKIIGLSDSDISIAINPNLSSTALEVGATLDYSILAENLLNTIEVDVDLYQKWCNLNCGCECSSGGGLSFDPDLVNWDLCEIDCNGGYPPVLTIEDGFNHVIEKLCCIYSLISQDNVGIKVFYVDSNNPSDGDGSILNPFRTLDLAIIKVIGTGNRENPEFSGITINVAGGVYGTINNMFINRTSWLLGDGTTINYNGVGYLVDCTTSITSNYDYFNISGKWTFSTVAGKLVRNHIRTNPTNSRIVIEIDSAYRTGGTPSDDPTINPLIEIDGTYQPNDWDGACLDLTVHGKIQSYNSDIIRANGNTRINIQGTNPSSSLLAGRVDPVSQASQRVLRYNYIPDVFPDNMYSSEIAISDIIVASDGESAIQLSGYYGGINLYRIRFYELRSVVHFQKSSIEIGDLRAATYSGNRNILMIRDCYFYPNIYGPDEEEAIKYIGPGGTPPSGYDRKIELNGNVIPSPYIISPELDVNSIIGTGYNIISTFSLLNLQVYADNTEALEGDLVEGNVYRTSTGDLKIVY